LLIVENTIEKSVKFRMKRRRNRGWKRRCIKTKKPASEFSETG
jgi:hypothetical protein